MMHAPELTTYIAERVGIDGPASTENYHWIVATTYHGPRVVIAIELDQLTGKPIEARIRHDRRKGWRVVAPVTDVDRAIACARILMGVGP